jgi:alpha-beta hydrolase superfamily lysophospholipase
MRTSLFVKVAALLLVFACLMANGYPAFAIESTMPQDKYPDKVNPELAAQYSYKEDGEFSKKIGIPTYEWMPVSGPPKAVVIGVHGLTLHGRRYRVLARALAINQIGFVSFDMRGFGKCRVDSSYSTMKDDKSKVQLEKSYKEVEKLAVLVKEKYPDAKLVILGESLGCTFAVRLAGDHKDIVYGIVLSAPAVKVNADMFAGTGNVARGLKAVVSFHHEMDLHNFIKTLVSGRKQVVAEMLDDPMITKKLSIGALLSVDSFVDKTAKWGKKTSDRLPILIIQGSRDGCVSPKHVTDLMANMPSNDQTLSWKGQFGHLQLETQFVRVEIANALVDWMYDHGTENVVNLETFQKNISELGGAVVKYSAPNTVADDQ